MKSNLQQRLFLQNGNVDITIPSITVQVTGAAKGKGLGYQYCKEDGTFNTVWMEADGTFTLPESVHTASQHYTGFKCNYVGEYNLTLTQIY